MLGDRDRLLAASSPTGPAFEGAQISGGQRAAPGAIERVRIDRETLEPRFRVIGVDAWSDEPGFADGVRRDRRHRDLRLGHHRGRRRAVPRRGHHRGRRHRRRAGGAHAARRPRRPDVQLRPPRRPARPAADPRHPERRPGDPAGEGRAVRGRPAADGPRWASRRSTRSGWPGRSAARSTHSTRWSSGSIPDCDLAQVRCGRQRGRDGRAHRAAVGRPRGARSRRVVRRVEKIETAVEPRFQEHFVEAMAFPHRTAPIPHLARGDRCRRGARRAVAAASAAGRRRRRATPATAVEQPATEDRLMDDRRAGDAADGRAAQARPGATPAVERRPVPDPDARPVRGPRRGGPLDSSSTTPTRSSRRSASSSAATPMRSRLLPRGRRRRPGRAGPLPARHVPPDRPGDRARAVHPVRPQPGAQRRDRRAAHGLRARTTARRSCATSTTAGATARSRTSATS